MNYDPRVEGKAKLICYHIESNEGIQLSDKSRHDLWSNVREVADYWKKDSDKLREENHQKRWNEFWLWLDRYPFASFEDLKIVKAMLNEGLYIRDFKPEYMREKC